MDVGLGCDRIGGARASRRGFFRRACGRVRTGDQVSSRSPAKQPQRPLDRLTDDDTLLRAARCCPRDSPVAESRSANAPSNRSAPRALPAPTARGPDRNPPGSGDAHSPAFAAGTSNWALNFGRNSSSKNVLAAARSRISTDARPSPGDPAACHSSAPRDPSPADSAPESARPPTPPSPGQTAFAALFPPKSPPSLAPDRSIDAVLVHVQRPWQAVLPHVVARTSRRRVPRFVLEEPRVDPARRVVDHHHQHRPAAATLEPVVMRAVHLHQLPAVLLPGATTTMRLPRPSPLPQSASSNQRRSVSPAPPTCLPPPDTPPPA